MPKTQVAWSAQQRDIIMKALGIAIDRLSVFLKEGDQSLKERHREHASLNTLIASQKAEPDGVYRFELDEDAASILKNVVTRLKAESR